MTATDQHIPTLALIDARMTVLDLVMRVRHGKTRAELRRFILRSGIEINGESFSIPEDTLNLETNDILRVGKGEWYRIEIVELNELETERLWMKPMHVKDIDLLQKHLPEWEIVKYLSVPESRKKKKAEAAAQNIDDAQDRPLKLPRLGKAALVQAQDVFRRIIDQEEPKNEWLWKVIPKAEPDRILGVAYLRGGDDPTENIWLDPVARDEFLMSEILAAVNEHAFSNLNLTTIQFQHAFAHASAPRELDMMRARFMQMDSVARSRDEPIGITGMTRDGWEKMKDWLRPGQSRGKREGRRKAEFENAQRSKNLYVEKKRTLDDSAFRTRQRMERLKKTAPGSIEMKRIEGADTTEQRKSLQDKIVSEQKKRLQKKLKDDMKKTQKKIAPKPDGTT
jgi:RimJ/RimL family protein N-acetyltransferase